MRIVDLYSAVGFAENTDAGIPFSLNWANIVQTHAETKCDTPYKREFIMSNTSFIVELASNSVCSFDTDLFTNDSIHIHTGTLEPRRPDSHPITNSLVGGDFERDVTKGRERASYDVSRDKENGIRKCKTDYRCSISSEDPETKIFDSKFRDFSNPFHVVKLESGGVNSVQKLVTSRGSSRKGSFKRLLDSKARILQWNLSNRERSRRTQSRGQPISDTEAEIQVSRQKEISFHASKRFLQV